MGFTKTVDFDTIIADLGEKVGLRVMKLYGGKRICSPNSRMRAILMRDMWRDYYDYGMPIHEIAARYRIKKGYCSQLIGVMRRKHNLSKKGLIPQQTFSIERIDKDHD